MTRHKKTETYSLSLVNGYEVVGIDTADWIEKNPAGLAAFVKIHVPNWKQLVVTKYVTIYDTRTRHENKIVGQKCSRLKFSRDGSSSFGTRVDENLRKDGVFPSNVLTFFGERQK